MRPPTVTDFTTFMEQVKKRSKNYHVVIEDYVSTIDFDEAFTGSHITIPDVLFHFDVGMNPDPKLQDKQLSQSIFGYTG